MNVESLIARVHQTQTALLSAPVYELEQPEKERLLADCLSALTELHRESGEPYRRVLDVVWPDFHGSASLAGIPFIPVGLFKSHELRSVAAERIVRVMSSSGTTGQQPSRVYLDAETAARQTAALSSIMGTILGPERLPMLIVDSPTLLRDRSKFSARAAGVVGMMTFGRVATYALREDMTLAADEVRAFLAKHGNGPFLIFGFTFMVWQHFLAALPAGTDLGNGILVHSGGWKKLLEQAVSNEEFKRALRERTGLTRVYNFYGMVEQVGSVFLEGDDGFLYPPAFADVIVRDPVTWQELPVGEEGVIQVVSALPTSYPGHSILTEDLGVVAGIDDGRAGRKGKRFLVNGRIPRSEVRGCSDTAAQTLAMAR